MKVAGTSVNGAYLWYLWYLFSCMFLMRGMRMRKECKGLSIQVLVVVYLICLYIM